MYPHGIFILSCLSTSRPKESDLKSLAETQDPNEPLGKKEQNFSTPLELEGFLMILKGDS